MRKIDHFIGNRAEFPILERWAFFNHGGVTPLPARVGRAFETYSRQAMDEAYLSGRWYTQIDELRSGLATMINASTDEIALTRNTSEGIATVAYGMDWKKGDRIVTTNVEYPANMYPWMDLASRFGVELVLVEEETLADGSRAVSVEKIEKELSHERTKMLALSHVEFASGQRFDLVRLGRVCKNLDVMFLVDAIQSMGILPVDVKAMGIDFLAADGHKWLLGPEGAGMFYCRKALQDKVRPLVMGWMNVINDQAYGDYDLTLKNSARRYEGGTHNVPGMLAFGEAVKLLKEAGIDAIAERIKLLGDRLILGLQDKGYRVISPREANAWSGCISFVSEVHDHGQIFRLLRKEKKTEIALREGRLRSTAHFYNTIEQMDQLVADLPGN